MTHTLHAHDISTKGNWLQVWRPRRRTKVLVAALLAITFSVFLFFAEFVDPTTAATSIATEKLQPELPKQHSFKASHKVHTVSSITTTTITAPAVTETVVLYQDVVKKPESVVFVLVIWSESSAIEGAVLIKSILLYNTSPTHLHIICDDDAQRYLESRFSLVWRPLHDVRIWFYKPTWQSMLDRVDREGTIKTDHSAGLPGLMKLFLHEILPPTVKKGIYVDTDALFITDPTHLWNVFARLKPSTAIVMSSHPDQHAPEWHHASRICSCVMLLDLEKLRDLRLIDSSHYRHDSSQPAALSPPAFQAMFGLPSEHGHYENVRLGDQGYWWAIVDHRPDIFEPLSYDFEVTSCLLDTYMTGLGDDAIAEKDELSRQIHTRNTPQEGTVILPKLLHFNCLEGTPVYLEWKGWSDPKDNLNIRWGPAVAYHSGYKWIWLNNGASTLEMSTITEVQFADELEGENNRVT